MRIGSTVSIGVMGLLALAVLPGLGGAPAAVEHPARCKSGVEREPLSEQDEGIVIRSGPYSILFSPVNGSVVRVAGSDAAHPIFRSGEHGLWQIRFRDGALLDATEFQPGSATRRFEWQPDVPADALRLSFRAPEAAVVVGVRATGAGFDFVGQVTPAEKSVLEFALPGRLRFDPDQVRRFIAPMHPHLGVGAAFNKKFFQPQPAERATSWRATPSGPGGYVRLFGAGLDMRDLNAPAVPLQVTEAGRQWLGPELAQRCSGATATVNRPSLRQQVDLLLLDSTDGPFFGASQLGRGPAAGGRGALWRFAGQFDERSGGLAADAVSAVVHKLAAYSERGPRSARPPRRCAPAARGPAPRFASPPFATMPLLHRVGCSALPGARRRLGLLNRRNGPDRGSWANLPVGKWRETFEQVARDTGLRFIELTRAEELLAAASSNDFLAILNPYGEGLPVPARSTLPETVDAIGRYIRAGGNWFEVGGYPFYSALQPAKFLSYEQSYPPVFADLLHLDAAGGSASLYRIQPREWKPWAGTQNPSAIFVPGRLAFGGDEQGGWCERAFGTFVKAGETWSTPTVRLALGHPAEEDLSVYCQANGITRTLREKLPSELFEKFRRAVLVKYNGSAREKIAALDRLPVPALLHFSDYLKGGFDKEYPDHLPPNPRFGTPQEMRELINRAHQLGHLVMPYTNPTWWCDHPRGPTFERAGEAPLLRDLDGKLSYERYGANDGWTTTLWHPAVRAANRETLRQFTEDYPVDLLFQDQCGARGWRYDTNPASPTPYATAEGMLSMVDEDSMTKPLSTEDGWDRVVNAEAQLCGITFALGPGRRTAFAPEMKSVYPPATWELYPFAQRIAHDKCAMLHHDLGKFVMDRPTLAWTLGIGFAMSYTVQARALEEPGPREWLKWLDRVQKSICARYVGEPVAAFEHRQGTETPGDDGVIRATYGPVRLVANLSPTPRREMGRELAGYGFYATAPGMVAGNLRRLAGAAFGEEGANFVTEGDARRAEVWLYAAEGSDAAAELPPGMSGKLVVTLDGKAPMRSQVVHGAIRFLGTGKTAPGSPPRSAKRLWHAVVAVR